MAAAAAGDGRTRQSNDRAWVDEFGAARTTTNDNDDNEVNGACHLGRVGADSETTEAVLLLLRTRTSKSKSSNDDRWFTATGYGGRGNDGILCR